jgi:hypothetical protein
MKKAGNIHAVNGRNYEKNQNTLPKTTGSGMGGKIHPHGRTP